MAGFSIKDLLSVLQKSGLPMNGSSLDMSKASLGASDAIGAQIPQVGGQDVMAQAKARYMAQIAQIAAMDQKLAGVYSDPSSKLYIEHPLKRETLIQGARKPGFAAADMLASDYKVKKADREAKIKDREAQIKEAERVYGKITTLQKKQEAADKKAQSAAKKAANTKKITGTNDEVTLTKDQKLAGFQDPNVANQWSSKPAQFKEEWKDNVLSGRWQVPDGGFTQKNFEETYNAWLADNPPAKKKTATDEIKNPYRK